MLTNKFKKKSALDHQIDDVYEKMMKEEVDSHEHATLLKTLTELYKIKKEQTHDRVDASTKATIVANLAGIVIVMNHERAHVISTKALSFLLKPKV